MARAEPDSFGLGTGRDGPMSATAPGTVVNAYAALSAPRLPGDTSLPVASTVGFAAGDLVMVLQTTGLIPEPGAGAPGPFDLTSDPVGRWELARLSGASAGALALTAPLVNGYAAGATQVIRVPEFTSVQVPGGTSLVAAPWNGATGGVLAFLATGTVVNQGALLATGAGFRGGQFVNQAITPDGCSELDQPPDAGGAAKGEGVAQTRYGPEVTGYGNVTHGAGGGVCHNAGGGGGGNGGAGGNGGRSWLGDGSRDIGGRGGARLVYTLMDHLTLGGGGGAGQGNDDAGTSGGAGGGAIFVRAGNLSGNGAIEANGQTAANTSNPGVGNSNDGAGGGGGGGSIYLRIAGPLTCSSLAASGGNGGSIMTAFHGPGGGGGGGRILAQATTLSCTPQVLSGVGGTQTDLSNPNGARYGAGPATANDPAGLGAVSTPPGPLKIPGAPILTAPAQGASVPTRRPVVTGTAEPSATVILFLDGAEWIRTAASGAGGFSHTPAADLSEGAHQLSASAELQQLRSPSSAVRAFTVDTVPPAVPAFTTPTAGALLATAQPTLAGTAEANASVALRVDGTLVGTVTASGAGAWSYTLAAGQALVDGSHGATAIASDAAGNPSPAASRAFSTDATPPQTSIDSGPPPITSADSAVLSFSSPESGLVFECSRGAQPFAPCTSPVALSGLADGSYLFRVRAVDAAGNVDPTPAQRTWIVDTQPPAAPVVVSPAAGSLVGPKPNVTGTTEPDAVVEVLLDGSLAGTTTASGTGAFIFTATVALSQGGHTAAARARDGANNLGPLSAPRAFSVDDVPPETTLLSTPANPSNSSSPQFSFSSNEGGSTFECAIDAAAFAPCPSPFGYTGRSDGSHTFQVRAKDPAGNVDPTPAQFDWVIDATAPAAPVILQPAPGTALAVTTLTFSGTAEPLSTVQLTLDGEKIGEPTADNQGRWTFTPTASLIEGAHVASARAADALGNLGPRSAEVPFAVDLTAPDTSIAGAPAALLNLPSAMFSFSASEPQVTFECRLDAGAFAPCTNPITFTGLADGEHTLEVRAKDGAGHVDLSPASHAWRVDTVGPAAPVFTSPLEGSEVTSGTPIFSGTAEPLSTVELTVDGARVAAVAADASGAFSYTLESSQALALGAHSATARATDPAGNAGAGSAPRAFSVSRLGVNDGGCHCGGAGGGPLALGLLALCVAAARRRSRSPRL